MYKKIVTLFSLLCVVGVGKAQYASVPVTGFTEDVIANGIGDANTSTTAPIDVPNSNYAYLSADFRANASSAAPNYSLPASGLLVSAYNTNVQFQLAPYTGNNALRLSATNPTGTLTLVTPRTAGEIHICAVSGSGASTGQVDVNFTDGSTQSFPTIAFPDWYNTTSPRVLAGVGRVNRGSPSTTAVNTLDGTAASPSMFHFSITIDGSNYNKLIKSITITRTGGGTDPIINIFAIAAKAPCSAPANQPTVLTFSGSTTNTIAGSFTAATSSPAGYLVVRYPAGSAVTAPVSGVTYTVGQPIGLGAVVADLAAPTTAFTANNLWAGTNYDFYVYSYSTGTTCAGPVYLTTTPLTGTRATTACSGPGNVTIPIGATGTYTTLTAALSSIATTGISGPVILQLQNSYTSAGETFPITVKANVCFGGVNNITIRPAAGANGVSITNATATPTIDLNGASYVTIDGTPGGSTSSSVITTTAAGSTNATNLNIINTNVGGVAIKVDTMAFNNTIKYCDIQGQSTASANQATVVGGVIYVGASGAAGNDNNVFDHNNIHSTGAATQPTMGIYVLGATNSGQNTNFNDNGVISNNNIYDFFSPINHSVGVEFFQGTNGWNITGNSFFQTVTQTYTTASNTFNRGMWIAPGSNGSSVANGFTINNNYIGGSAPLCAGNSYTLTALSNMMEGIRLEVADGAVPNPTSVQGNIIKNISINSTITGDAFHAIWSNGRGNVNIGTVTGNVIGTPTGAGGAATGGITITAGSGSSNHMILISAATGTPFVNVKNNTIGNIYLTSAGNNFSGIFVNNTATVNIDNNIVGSLTTPNSINMASTGTGTSFVRGINVSSGVCTVNMTNNTIANLNDSTTSTSSTSQTAGIVVVSTTAIVNTITGNTIRNLSCATASTGTGVNTAVIGIASVTTAANNLNISGNTIHSLVATSASTSAGIIIDGIYFTGTTSGQNIISKNLIHSFDVLAVNPSAVMAGLDIAGGTNAITNNMIRLGIRPDGTDLAQNLTLRGIFLNTTANNNIWHNSVYLGGTTTGTAGGGSVAFRRNVTSGTHDIQNNIFFNSRSNSATSGAHYIFSFATAMTGATINYNVYQYTGSGAVFANNGSANIAAYAPTWFSSDANSFAVNPQFINATGTAANVNLHINASAVTSIEGTGIAAATTTDDIDGQTRSGLTPVDIGADAGNFVALSVCAKPNVPTALVLTAASTNQINGSFTASASGANGYVVVRYPNAATPVAPVDGTFYSIGDVLGSGVIIAKATATTFTDPGLFANTTYLYYVYAYNDICTGGVKYSNGLSGTKATTACSGVSGTVTVGATGATYTSLTAALAGINGSMSGAVTLELQSNYTTAGETFPITINPNTCITPTNTLTIRPATGANGLSISSSNALATIDIRNASYVTIDGTPGGSTGSSTINVTTAGTTNATNLNIINTNATGVAIKVDSGSSSNTIKYCDLQGQNTANASQPTTTAGVVYIGASGTTGNDKNTIDHCNIHATGTGTNQPSIGIYVQGANNTGLNTNFNDSGVISNNNVYDFFLPGGNSAGIELNQGVNAWKVTGNSLFQTGTQTFTAGGFNRGIWICPNRNSGSSVGNGFTVSNNYLGGVAPFCGGTAYTLNAQAHYFWGIMLEVADGATIIPSILQNNTIKNVSMTSTMGSASDVFRGITVTNSIGNVNILDNTIGDPVALSSINIAAGSGSHSIMLFISNSSGGNTTINVTNNKIGGITVPNVGCNFSCVFDNQVGTVNFTNNLIGSLTTANSINLSNTGTTAQFLRGFNISGGSGTFTFVNNTVANLTNATTSTTSPSQTIGIYIPTTPKVPTITGNVIRNLSCAAGSTATGVNSAVLGIGMTSTVAQACDLSGNTIHSLVSTSASTSAGLIVEGIYFSGNTTVNNTITKNFIHSLDVTAANTSAVVAGMDIANGTNTIANNMIRLGIRPDGTDLSTNLNLRGIFMNTTAANNLYHNSIYIGGTTTGTTGNGSVALRRNANGTYDIQNNIFSNIRSTSSGIKHYTLILNSTSSLPTINYNVYQFSGTGGNFASFDGGTTAIPYYTFVSPWIATDVNSISGNPQFINPAGSTAVVDLHINTSAQTVVEGKGTALAVVTDDYDGQTRSTLTPTDIGADAGNFVVLPGCVAPVNQPTTLLLNPISATQINGSFTASSPAADGYLVVSYFTGASPVAPTTGAIYTVGQVLGAGTIVSVGNATTFSATPLIGNTSYTFYVYAYSSNCIGGPVYKITTPLTGTVITQPCNSTMTGIVAVGPGQTYPTLTDALTYLNANGMGSSVILQLQSNYVCTTETFPITINKFGCLSPSNTLTIRPAAGANGLSIISNNANATIDIRGANYVTIDGTPGGSTGFSTIAATATGALNAINLNIVDTNTAGVAIKIDTNASYNTIKYCDVHGRNIAAAAAPTTLAGVIYIGVSGAALTTGNDNNIIDHCNIHATGATTQPSIGIYVRGADNVGLNTNFNDSGSITNNNIYDFFSPTGNSVGIELNHGVQSWKITGNSIFQSVTQTYTTTSSSTYNRGIWLLPDRNAGSSVGNGFLIANNYIGGSAPLCAGAPYTVTALNNYMEAIRLETADGVTANPTSVQGNTIRNISVTTTNTGDAFHAIWSNGRGSVDIGTVTGNMIGDTTKAGGAATGGITIAAGSGSPSHFIIVTPGSSATPTINIKNNSVGNVLLTGAGNHFSGIFVNNVPVVIIDNNKVGSVNTPNSINASSTSTTGSFVRGINISSGACTVTITNNTVANLNDSTTSTTTTNTHTAGIAVISTGAIIPAITGNTIRDLSCAAASAGTGVNSAVMGIGTVGSSTTATNIVGNTVHSLIATSASTTAAIQVEGIFFSGSTTASHVIARNFVHSLDVLAANPAAVVTGIDMSVGTITTQNNMVRLGIKADGTSIVNPMSITGILYASSNLSSINFNSVYVGGTSVAITSTPNTYAFRRTGSSTNTYDVRNNIFTNVRSNTAVGGGKHYALAVSGGTVSLTANYNIYLYNGIDGNFGSTDGGTTPISVYSSTMPWLVGDVNSKVDNPQFINPTGNAAAVNLHISTTLATPVEAKGIAISTVTDDFDGDVRANLTPTDIGADAGNFIAPSVTITGTTTVCAGSPLTLTASSSLASPTYSWAGPNSFSFNGATMTIASPTSLAAGVYTVTAVSGGNNYTATTTVTITPAPNITAIGSNTPLCVGNQLNLTSTVSVSGTAAYAWTGPNSFVSTAQNPAKSNVTTSDAGTYTLKVTANGCSATANTAVVINANPVISSVSNSGTACEGGQLSLNANATGAGTLTYAWTGPSGFSATQQNPTRSPLASNHGGTYTVVVSAGGCTATGSTTVVVNPLPVIGTIANNGPICEGDMLNLFGASTTIGATYSWLGPNGFFASVQNPARYNVSANDGGAYTLSVTANNCTATATTNVVVRPKPVVTSVINNGPICAGNELDLTANVVTTGVTYQWSGPNGYGSTLQNPTRSNATVAYSGIYTVKITSNENCSVILNTTVVVNPLPQPNVTYANHVLSTGSFTSYQWYRNGTMIQGATGSTYTVTQTGTYSVMVTDGNGCSSMSPDYNVNEVSVQAIANDNIVRIYPNPAQSVVYIDASVPLTVHVYAMDGKVVIVKENAKEINIANLADGMYLFRLYDAEGNLAGIQKVIKNN